MGHILTPSYREIISLDNLLAAWEEFTAGKRKRADVRVFARALLHNILALHEDLSTFSCEHSGYESFMVYDPKSRNIHKAAVRDRLLHRAIYRILYPVFDTAFIHCSYSCRNQKGTHRAFRQLTKYTRQVSHNYTSPCWAIKMDIRRFFDNIDHNILLELLKSRIADPAVMTLLEKIIKSFEPSLGKGMPLGNLTSQLFANIYMDPLDKFIKHKLKTKYYLRYADDFLLLSSNQNELLGFFVEISRFVRERLQLTIHPDKIFLRKLIWGIDFTGYVALPHFALPRQKTVKRILKNLKIIQAEEPDKLEASLQSYFGYLKHANTFRIRQELGHNFIDPSF